MVNIRFKRARGTALGKVLLTALLAFWALAETALPALSPLADGPQAAGLSQAATGVARKAVGASAKRNTSPKSSSGAKSAPALNNAAQVPTGQRDPFREPQTPAPPSGQPPVGGGPVITGPLPPGTRGIVIGQAKLEGIVREETGKKMIAVVTVPTNRAAYFLHENDPLYNGSVSKITIDSVSFKENFVDPEGHPSTREMVLRLPPAQGVNR